jgi:hypothetical protein
MTTRRATEQEIDLVRHRWARVQKLARAAREIEHVDPGLSEQEHCQAQIVECRQL